MGQRRLWCPDADVRLRALWEMAFSLDEMAAALGCTPGAIFHRARDLGLRRGPPPGYEFFTAAAARVGYHTSQLRVILGWAGVEICPIRATSSRARPAGIRRKHTPRGFVDPEAVNDAIAAWVASEAVSQAAARHGLSPNTIRRWLLAAHAQLGLRRADIGRRGRKRPWRIDPVLVDHVVAHRKQTMHKKRPAPYPIGLMMSVEAVP